MWQRIISFLVVLLLMFPGKIFAQLEENSVKIINGLSIRTSPKPFRPKFSAKTILQIPACGVKSVSFKLVGLPTASTYPQSLGIICRTELKLDKITPMPFRFRLGSVDYVNWMEQKPNAVRLQ